MHQTSVTNVKTCYNNFFPPNGPKGRLPCLHCQCEISQTVALCVCPLFLPIGINSWIISYVACEEGTNLAYFLIIAGPPVEVEGDMTEMHGFITHCEMFNFNLCSLNTPSALIIVCAEEYKMLNYTNLYTKLQNWSSKYKRQGLNTNSSLMEQLTLNPKSLS